MSYYSTYEDMVSPQSRGIESDREHAEHLLAIDGWTAFSSEREMAEALVERWDEDGLSLDIADEIAVRKYYLASALDNPSNETEFHYGERAAFDYDPTEAQVRRITAHCIAIVMRRAGLSLSDLPIQEAA